MIGAKAFILRRLSTVSANRLRVCVVGSGPAGFYTADKMLRKQEGAEVDIIDGLPMPFGLVRSGVAPDHPETKIVTNQFTRVAQNERCSFFGNVLLGSSVSLSELREMYHVVVLAYGAESDRALGIPGEDLSGIHSAREFVWWYNGHPDYRYFSPDLKNSDTAVILGQGNVALDAARILLRPTEELATTDIANHALAALEESSIRKVYLVGRRGPAQAACTAKELREILGIKELNIHIQEADLVKTSADEEELKNNRIHRRVHELFSKAAALQSSRQISGQRELHFVFFRKPEAFLNSEDSSCHVGMVRFEKTILKEDTGSRKSVAVGTGQFDDLKCRLVLKSIGYKSVPVDKLPFDTHRAMDLCQMFDSLGNYLEQREIHRDALIHEVMLDIVDAAMQSEPRVIRRPSHINRKRKLDRSSRINRKRKLEHRVKLGHKVLGLCFKCGSPTHMRGHCPQSLCVRCGRIGHTQRFCKIRPNKPHVPEKKKEEGCDFCGKMGHLQKDCRLRARSIQVAIRTGVGSDAESRTGVHE